MERVGLTGDLRLVQEALGHSSPNITAIYAAFDTSKTAGAMAQVAASIEEVSSG